ncbi:helicase-related protein [Halomarina rubra]|uniref:Helicase-related protein n=1 Tax=Halomarina rubra TaxID=2071873 RepID=A0ABD6AU99_9EURY|nr:helicase-related protein [Halomarina rubra]
MEPRFETIPPRGAPEYTRPPDGAYEIESDPEYRRHQAVDHVISERLINHITGRGPRQATLYGNTPSRRCFAGVLADQYRYREAQEEDDSFQNFAKDVSPFSIGLKFQVDPDDISGIDIEVTPQAKLFYQRLPTYNEQERFGEVGSGRYDDAAMTPEEREAMADGGTSSLEDQTMLSVYERLDPDFETVSISGTDLRDAARLRQVEEYSLTATFDEARNEYARADRVLCEPASGVNEWDAEEVPGEALTDEEAFEEHLADNFSDQPKPALWRAKVRVVARQRDDGNISVSISLVNTHGESIETDTKPDNDWQAHLYDAGLSVTAESPVFRSFPSEEIRDHYQYDGNIYGIGENCSVERIGSDPVTGLRTNSVPIYQQPKYHSRETNSRGTIEAPFKELAHGDIDSVLENIQDEMEIALKQYRDVRGDILAGDKTDEAAEKFEETLEEFAGERDRFQQGRELIQSDERVQAAFRALNETFDSLGDKYEKWRLFQIVFIVMSIPDIVEQADPERDIDTSLDVADVIYFPTGGGKTEAYLGLVVMTAFHDRLRGKNHGMTALTKFPLRLLSLQQLQRITDVLCRAEVVRRNHDEMGGDGFSVGYFVGQQNTPNKTYDKSYSGSDTNNVELAKEDSDLQDEWLTVPDCPFCEEDGTVELTGDLDRMRIVHECTNSDCPEVQEQGGETAELPIYITDEEVYRYTPTFVVSTIDKIAIVGWQRRMRSLFGQVKNYCPKHGYTGESECLVADGNSYGSQFQCDNQNLESVETTDPPSILIQDELHLLREEFGAFDSHYETFIQELINRYTDGRWNMKVVAATATIKGAQNQVNALYWRDSNTFPTAGPRLHQSFYAYEDPHELGRRMIGAIPRTISRTLAINSIIRERAMIVQELQADLSELEDAIHELNESVVGGPLDFPESEPDRHELLKKLLKQYEVQVSYNIAKTRSDMLQRTVQQMINEQLEAFGDPYHTLRSVALTGETDMDVVRDSLSRLEADDPVRPIDIVIATSMISHGVDVNKLNFISFFGMPRNTAEYIQAYSRVGRKHSGSVFVLFDAMRARDRSHYTRFEHYHRYQDLLVEATPLERWAQFAIDRTMPGVIVGLFLQYYDFVLEGQTEKRLYMFDGFNEAFEADLITRRDALDFVLRAYSVTEEQETEWADIHGMNLYRDRIEDQFDKVWDRLLDDPLSKDGRGEFIANVVEGDSDDEHGPMNSLRDIDRQVDIVPNRYSTYVVESLKQGDH